MRNILPKENRLKRSFYSVKSMIKPLSLGYQKINTCPNFWMLYYFKNIELTECRTCRYAHCKPITNRKMILITHKKKLRYFSITPKLQKLFMSLKTIEHMTYFIELKKITANISATIYLLMELYMVYLIVICKIHWREY
jgi:hypothetical protein